MFNNSLYKRVMPLMAEDAGGASGAASSTTATTITSTGTSGGITIGNAGKDGGEPKSFADVLKANPDFQSELDRRINSAVETATKNERERQQIIKDSLQDEVLRVSKMTQAEKDAYFKEKAEKEAKDREASLTKRELTLDARSALQDKHMPEAFLDLLNYADKDACMKSIDVLEAAFNVAVQEAVNEKLKGGKPPKDAATEGEQSTPETKYDEALAEARKIAGIKSK